MIVGEEVGDAFDHNIAVTNFDDIIHTSNGNTNGCTAEDSNSWSFWCEREYDEDVGCDIGE